MKKLTYSSPSTRPATFPARALAHILASLVLLTSCDNGGGGGGGVVPTIALGGGISGTGQAIGQIDAFGSIFLNGIRWDIASADIVIDDLPGTEADLDVGMVVQVEGNIVPGSVEGVATRVSYEVSLRGPVASIDFNADGNGVTVEILGQDVLIEDGVSAFVDTDLGTIAISDVLEVSGFVDATGTLRASRVRDRGTLAIGTTQVKLRGLVQNFDGVDSFEIGTISVGLSASTDLTGLSSSIADGVSVEVTGTLSASDTVEATDIDDAVSLADDSATTSIEGFITDFVDLSDFTVLGVSVDATAAMLTAGGAVPFGNGSRVEVEGASQGGTLFADALRARGANIRIHAEVASPADVDLSAGTVILLGVTVTVDASTLLDDKRDDLPGFGLGDVFAGDFLEIRGFDDGVGGVIATRLERDDTDDVILQGRVTDFDAVAETLTILGNIIATDSGTDFEDEFDVPFSSAAEFFALLGIGDLVKVKDREDGIETDIDIADDVEFELEN